eukprot:TRINITY_DN68950_c0_g1_i1.p1 TRINITY_DN68950_c0_g1~~TRINITY_DN68950_c0_g1_i1.p1  ORF type:complete len:353 (+),score=74.33 TRINITY_DN68950_c0_g1_i1:95-1060(+)
MTEKFEDAEEAVLHNREPEFSLGAVAHGSGLCKPCAWFWKPKGCLNGEACKHCHLCPSTALKAAKAQKKKLSQERKEAEQQNPQCLQASVIHTEPAPESLPFREPPGLTLPQEDSPQQLLNPTLLASIASFDVRHVKTVPSASAGQRESSLLVRPHSCQSGQIADHSPPAEGAKSEDMLALENAGDDSELSRCPLDRRDQQEASIGSLTHGIGECRPCAWFWKPGGCNNGLECQHCHLCEPGELQRKKKEKKKERTKASADPTSDDRRRLQQALAMQQQMIEQQQLQLMQLQAQLHTQEQIFMSDTCIALPFLHGPNLREP